MKTRSFPVRHALFAVTILVAAAACSTNAPTSSREAIGKATIAIAKAPPDVGCIRVTVASDITVRLPFDVTPGQASVFSLEALPIGPSTFSADAFSVGCGAVDAHAIPDWTSDPVLATVTAAPPVSVSLAMHHTGTASVGIDFSEDGGAAEGGAFPADYALSIAPALVATTLGTQSHYTLTLSSSHFTGPVTLTSSGLPAGWSTTITPATVNVPVDGTATADLMIDVPILTVGVPATLRVDANGAPGVRSASSAFVVANEYDLTIQDGAGTGPHGLPAALTLKTGTTLRVVDADTSTFHEIHSDGSALGFPHQAGPMAAGQSYAGTLTGTGTFSFYCHSHGPATGTTTVTVVP